MAKKKFFVDKKKLGKSMGDSFTRTGITSVSYLGAKGGTNLIRDKIPEKFRKLTGPVKFLLGSVIDGMTEQTHAAAKFVKPLGVGIAISGAEDMVMEFIPADTRAKIGLAGVSISGPSDEFDLDAELEKMAAAAEDEAATEQEPAPSAGDGFSGVDGNRNESYQVTEEDLL